MGKNCEHYTLDCKEEERTCKGCAYNKKSLEEEPIIADFISNRVKAMIENENKMIYGIISLIMKKCNIKELEFTLYELENVTYNKLITIKNPKTNNLIVKVVK